MLERRHIISPDGARRARIVASDDLIFLSGLQADRLDGDVKAQTREALAQVDAALAEMGEDQSAIFMVHVWLKDMRDFSAMNAAWNAWADPENPPARTCVSGELTRPDCLVEVVVTACRTRGRA
ncbi:MAG: Rid family hydrolase [Alkalilacustris sp.]